MKKYANNHGLGRQMAVWAFVAAFGFAAGCGDDHQHDGDKHGKDAHGDHAHHDEGDHHHEGERQGLGTRLLGERHNVTVTQIGELTPGKEAFFEVVVTSPQGERRFEGLTVRVWLGDKDAAHGKTKANPMSAHKDFDAHVPVPADLKQDGTMLVWVEVEDAQSAQSPAIASFPDTGQ